MRDALGLKCFWHFYWQPGPALLPREGSLAVPSGERRQLATFNGCGESVKQMSLSMTRWGSLKNTRERNLRVQFPLSTACSLGIRRPDGSVGMALVLPALTDCRWWFESLLVYSGVSSATRRKATGADHKKAVSELLGGPSLEVPIYLSNPQNGHQIN